MKSPNLLLSFTNSKFSHRQQNALSSRFTASLSLIRFLSPLLWINTVDHLATPFFTHLAVEVLSVGKAQVKPVSSKTVLLKFSVEKGQFPCLSSFFLKFPICWQTYKMQVVIFFFLIILSRCDRTGRLRPPNTSRAKPQTPELHWRKTGCFIMNGAPQKTRKLMLKARTPGPRVWGGF